MKQILFMLIPVALILLAFRTFQLHMVSGKITDEKGTALASVHVAVKGTNIATLSATDGTYQVNVSDKNATLVFSAVGYDPKEILINGKSTIHVTMKPSVHALQEVVVTGYNQTK